MTEVSRENFRNLSKEEIAQWLESRGEKAFRARQVHEWLWQKGARSFDAMSNLSKPLREKLKEDFDFNSLRVDLRQESKDTM